jgi:hypothetical protein
MVEAVTLRAIVPLVDALTQYLAVAKDVSRDIDMTFVPPS